MSVAIFGAGISGLSAAYFIKKINPAIKICLFEQQPTPGGCIKTLAK